MYQVGDFDQIMRVEIDEPADEVIKLCGFGMINVFIGMIGYSGADLRIAKPAHDDASLVFGEV